MAVIQPPDEERAKLYESMSPKAAKFLLPDGSIVDGMPSANGNSGGNSTGSFFQSVDTYADLPQPVSDYKGLLFFVTEGSGGLLSAFGMYKYPRGFYSPNTDGEWEQVPIQVRVAENAVTLLNITDWSEYYQYTDSVNSGDMVLFNAMIYQNITGEFTDTPPSEDDLNWQIFKGEKGDTGDKGDVTLAAFSVGVEDGILYLYAEDSAPNPFEYDEASGTLYYKAGE